MLDLLVSVLLMLTRYGYLVFERLKGRLFGLCFLHRKTRLPSKRQNIQKPWHARNFLRPWWTPLRASTYSSPFDYLENGDPTWSCSTGATKHLFLYWTTWDEEDCACYDRAGKPGPRCWCKFFFDLLFYCFFLRNTVTQSTRYWLFASPVPYDSRLRCSFPAKVLMFRICYHTCYSTITRKNMANDHCSMIWWPDPSRLLDSKHEPWHW